jgi:two-component system, sensor histidine kinase YesM
VKIRSLQLSIILGFTILIFFTILTIGTFTFYLFGDTLRRNSLDNSSQVVTQLNRQIDNYISNMDDTSQVVVQHSEVQDYVREVFSQKGLREININGISQHPADAKITSLFQSIISVRKDIKSIMLLLDNKTVVTNDPKDRINPFAEWLTTNSSADPTGLLNASLSSSYVQDLIVGKYSWVITLRRDVLDTSTNVHRGILLVDLDYSVIEELCSNIQLGKSGYVFIINPTGEIVYHPRQQLLYSGLKYELIDRIKNMPNGQMTEIVDGREVLYTTKTSRYTGWTVVGVSFVDELFYNRSEIEYYFAMIAVACFLISVVISFFISVKISRPIEVLRRSVQAIEGGNFDIDIKVNSTDEVNGLAQDFNIANRKIKELIEQNALTYEQKRKHELKALQAQINPHFLYNTLDSIIWMIECGESKDAITMISTLAKFFRLGISKGGDIITVQDEIDHLNCYLTIQKMRYKDSLDFLVDVDPEILSCQTLKLLIQPLVENAIYHGLKTQDRIGMLKVIGFKEGNDLIFKVIDNGKGMTSKELSDIFNAKSNSKGSGGVGVKNVRDRIQLYFGAAYGVSFESIKGEGTIATIRLPAVIESEL